MKVISEED